MHPVFTEPASIVKCLRKIDLDSKNTIFTKSKNCLMKKLKVSEVLKMLSDDGWYLSDQKGSHRQFKHHTKKGKVTVNGKPSDTLEQFILNNIFKQTGWR